MDVLQRRRRSVKRHRRVLKVQLNGTKGHMWRNSGPKSANKRDHENARAGELIDKPHITRDGRNLIR